MTNPEHFTDKYLNQVASNGTAAAEIAALLLLFPESHRQSEYDAVVAISAHPPTIIKFLRDAFQAYEVAQAWPSS